jgi:4a-hydroxytetrahydrobiopterin dehydratase
MKKTTPTLTRTDKARIKKLGTNWQIDEKGKKLTATFDFNTYLDAFMFITRVIVHSEVAGHHPELHLTHDNVKVILSTSDVKAVTALDIDLAERINNILSTNSRRR